MNIRLSEGAVRVRLDPADLESLDARAAASFEVGPPGSLRCEILIRDDDGPARLEFAPHALRILLDEASFARLREGDAEEVDFDAPLDGGRELHCSIQKDRRTFTPRHKRPRPE